MNKKITISDIAQLSGVSKTTVSHFLNQKYEGMSEATRNRIQKIVDELEYRPNRQARALKSQHSSIVGISVADISNSYTSRILKGMMDCLKNTQYHTVIMDADLNKAREQSNVDKLLDEQVDGILIQPLGEGSTDYNRIPSTLPVVQIDRYVEPLIWPAVVSDNFIQSRNLAQLFLEKDYQRVVVVTPPIDHASPRVNRYQGLKDALADTDVEIIPIITPEIKDIVAQDKEIWEQISPYINDKVKTVIYAFNGGLLYGVIKFLKYHYIAVPEKVGVVGYDDGSWADLMNPAITSIEQDPVQIGYKAAEMLLDNIRNNSQIPELICVDSKLNIHKSL